jgi:hypothetical protein
LKVFKARQTIDVVQLPFYCKLRFPSVDGVAGEKLDDGECDILAQGLIGLIGYSYQ